MKASEPDHPNSPPPSLSPTVPAEITPSRSFQPASVHARRAACTHIVMERLYGVQKCGICQMPSRWGWVYGCVQDNGHLPLKDETSTATLASRIHEMVDQESRSQSSASEEQIYPISPRISEPDNGSREPTVPVRLSPWIEKAILEGHYTPTQIFKMRAQRQQAIEAAAAAEKHIREHPEHSANPPPSPTTSPQSQDGTENSQPNDVPPATEVEGSLLKDRGVEPSDRPRMFPRCHFYACQRCRPTFRDRTWVKFEDVMAQTGPIPLPNFETDPRCCPSKDTIGRLGLRVYPAPTFEELNPNIRIFPPMDEAMRRLPLPLLPDWREVTDELVEAESGGFRESMKRAFRGMLSRNGRTLYSRAYRKRRTRYGRNRFFEFDMNLFTQLNEELLREASSIPLPGHDGMDGLADEEGEIEVEEGVAVTEEGVDLGTADIIMSV